MVGGGYFSSERLGLEFSLNLLLGELPGVVLEEGDALVQGHGHLLLGDGDHAPGQVVVVLEHELDGDEDVVDVVEDLG